MSVPIINKDILRQVQKQIDKRISDLFIQADHNICKPYVCILCDIFVKPKEIQLISGPYNTINLMKNDYILLKRFGFEELDFFTND